MTEVTKKAPVAIVNAPSTYDVAPYYFELTTEVLALADAAKWGMANDHFQSEMWAYAEAYWQVVEDAFQLEGDFPGVPTYDLSENMAKVLVGKSKDELVSIDEFKKSARHVVNKWLGKDKELDSSLGI